jgi:molybdopterin-guanine dinucleotide biosynthesis protein A
VTGGIVLAGGRSRRFGRDKLAAPLADGRPLLRHAVEAVAAACGTVVVVLPPGTATPDWMPPGVLIAHDPEPFGGPLVGLIAGLEAIDEEIVIVAGGDMPSLAPTVLRLLATSLASAEGASSARLEATKRPGGVRANGSLPAILPCALRRSAALAAARRALSAGDRRLRALFEGSTVVLVPEAAWRQLDPTAASLVDVDRPSDLPGSSHPFDLPD